MPDINGIPYVESTDLVSAYPAASQALAQEISDQLASKLPYSYGTATPTTTVSGFLWYDSNSTPAATKFWDGSAFVPFGGKILQVVSTLKQDTFTTTSTTYVDVTGLSATITPSSASNTILVLVTLTLASDTDAYLSRGVVLRGSTIIGAGTPAGNRPAANFSQVGRAGAAQTAVFVDSPATTSATTYKVQVATENTATATVGRGFGSDGDVAHISRVASSVTVMEISA